ncbi:MAG TPA: hypothetical protein V6C58_08280 [Allocoleopsis sp.]
MLKKLLGIGKNDFYMELKEDSKASTPVAEKKPTPAKVEATPTPVAEKKAEPAKVEATAAPVAEKKAEPAKVETTAAPVAKVATPKVSGFASTPYWNNSFSGTPRRLPSANMSGFLNLARQVKKPGA